MADRLTQVNTSDTETCVAMLEGLVELSPWVIRRGLCERPFSSPEAVAQALVQTIVGATRAEQVTLIRAHPDLAGRAARDNAMTEESNSEQGRLGLLNLSPDDLDHLDELNRAYRERFGMPFILALHRMSDLLAVLSEFETRLKNTPEQEHHNALQEITSVVRNRTLNFFAPSGPDVSAPAYASPSGQNRTPRKERP